MALTTCLATPTILDYPNSSYPPLHLALLNDSLDVARVLLKSGVTQIHLVDKAHETILHKAASARNLQFIELILDWKKKTNDSLLNVDALSSNNRTALNKALENPNVSHGTDDDTDAMDVDKKKTKKGKASEMVDRLDPTVLSVVQSLVEKGNAKIHYSTTELPPQSQQQLFGHHHSNQPASSSAQVRNTLLQPIIQAAEATSHQLLAYLLDKGAHVNYFNSSGDTPLDIVLRYTKGIDDKLNPKPPTTPAHHDYNSSMREQCDREMAKYSKNSFCYNELSQHRPADPVQPAPAKPENIDQLEFSLKVGQSAESVLHKHKAKKFSQVTLSSDDSYMSKTHDDRKQYRSTFCNYANH